MERGAICHNDVVSSRPSLPGIGIHPRRLTAVISRWQSCRWFLIILLSVWVFPNPQEQNIFHLWNKSKMIIMMIVIGCASNWRSGRWSDEGGYLWEKSGSRRLNDEVTPGVLWVLNKFMSSRGSLPVYSVSSLKVTFLFLRLHGYTLRQDLQLKGILSSNNKHLTRD